MRSWLPRLSIKPDGISEPPIVRFLTLLLATVTSLFETSRMTSCSLFSRTRTPDNS